MKYLVFDCETEAFEKKTPQPEPPAFAAMGWRCPDMPGEVQIETDLPSARLLIDMAIGDGLVIVGHNLSFDLWVLGIKPLPGQLFWDTMIADRLQLLAYNDGGGAFTPFVSLEKLLRRPMPGKGDTQLSYVPGQPLTEEQERYLRGDVEATWEVCERQLRDGVPGGVKEISLQLRAACALADLERTGLHVDKHELQVQRKAFVALKAETRRELIDYGLYEPESTGPRGGIKLAHKKPSVFSDMLGFLAEYRGQRISRTPTGRVKADKDAIKDYMDVPPVAAWAEYSDAEKALSFLDAWNVGPGIVRGRYKYMIRSGRTSSSNPNMQNIPSRGQRGDLKKCFVAPPGRVFYELDYGQLELCTLGFLTQGEMLRKINQDQDLHCFLASQFFERPITKADAFERQFAKAGNFGFPGGMGANKFRTYARGYGVTCTMEQAQDLRNKWLAVFPEMQDWLTDKDDWVPREIRDVWYGKPGAELKGLVWDGTWCVAGDVAWLVAWAQMRDLGKQAPGKVIKALKDRQGCPALEVWLTHRAVVVPGGRKRCPVSYTEQRNTRFQGLAANLTKEALSTVWATMPDVTIHGFVHDSLLVSLEDTPQQAHTLEHIAQVMIAAAHKWIPGVLVHVEASGPGISWYDAKNGGKIEF